MRHDALRENGWCYPVGKHIPEDYHLWAAIAQRHELINLPRVYLDYRIWPNSMCQKPWPQLRDQCVVAQSRLLANIGLTPNDAQKSIQRALAFDEIAQNPMFIEAAHQWLLAIWNANQRRPFFDSEGLARVLTGRFIALVRAAARCEMNLNSLAASPFRAYVEVPLPFAA